MAEEKKPPSEKNLERTLEAKRQAKIAASRIRNFLKRKNTVWGEMGQLFSSLFSDDRLTRQASALFMFGLLGLILVIFTAVQRFWDAKKTNSLAEAFRKNQKIEETLKKGSEETKNKVFMTSLGSFTIELKEIAKQRLGSGQVNMAEIEIILRCDVQDTCDFIEDNRVPVRNQLSNVLTAMDRQDFLSREGKKKLKTRISRKLNDWLKHGKIEDVYFSKIIMS